MRDNDYLAGADLDRVVRHEAKRYDFAAVNHPVSKATDFARLLRAGPANDIAEIAHRQTHPLGSLHSSRSGEGARSASAAAAPAVPGPDGLTPRLAFPPRPGTGEPPTAPCP